MAITKKDVEYVSKLARIKMTDKELNAYTTQLDNILEYMNKLNELDTKDIQPTAHLLHISNVTREDELTDDSLSNKEALKNAPDKADKFFRVPKVIE